jgi:hypothetical protein
MHSNLKRMYCAGILVLCGVALSACGGYDVELKGGVFDYLGVSDIGKKKSEPRMTQRTGIVVPPTTAALPVPGSRPAPQQVATSDGQQWPINPEDAKAAKTSSAKQQHLAFCEEQQKKYDARLIETMENGPLGSCEKSVLKNFTGQGITFQQETQKPSQ